MFKLKLVHKWMLLMFSVVCTTVISGCTRDYLDSSDRYVDHTSRDTSNGYLFHSNHDEEYYQANNGVYYYKGDDNRYHYAHRYYPDSKNSPDVNNRLSTRVRSYLLADPKLRNQMIAVKNDNGRVELTGSVSSASLKQRAVDVTREVPGVDYIDDDMVVKP